MRESLLLHSTNIVVYPNILLFMGLHYFISFAVFVVQFSRCVLNGCLLCYRRLVGTSGFEPPTSRLSGVRSNHLSYAPMFLGLFTCYPHNPFPGSCGGDEEDRTPDPLRARQMLSQLSYTPKSLLRESLSEPSKLNNILLRPSTPRIQESTLLSPTAFSP